MSAGAARAPKKRSQRRPAQAGQARQRKPYPVWIVTTAAFLLPGSGQMLNGNPIRGIVMQFFMLMLGFITYQITTPDISFVGRFAGGIFVYVMSVIDANTVAKRRMAAWMKTGGATPAQQGASTTKRPPEKRTPARGQRPAGKGKTARPGGKRSPRPGPPRDETAQADRETEAGPEPASGLEEPPDPRGEAAEE